MDYHQAHFFSLIPEYDFKDPTTGQPLVFPAMRKVFSNLKPPRVKYGPRFFMPAPRASEEVPIAYVGLQDNVPPTYFGPPYETRVPFFDADGNGIGGIRPLELRGRSAPTRAGIPAATPVGPQTSWSHLTCPFGHSRSPRLNGKPRTIRDLRSKRYTPPGCLCRQDCSGGGGSGETGLHAARGRTGRHPTCPEHGLAAYTYQPIPVLANETSNHCSRAVDGNVCSPDGATHRFRYRCSRGEHLQQPVTAYNWPSGTHPSDLYKRV